MRSNIEIEVPIRMFNFRVKYNKLIGDSHKGKDKFEYKLPSDDYQVIGFERVERVTELTHIVTMGPTKNKRYYLNRILKTIESW